jgi:hypothetical protein
MKPKCAICGCKAKPLYYHVLKLWPVGAPRHCPPHAELESDLRFCEAHKNDWPGEMLPMIKSAIARRMRAAGLPEPDLDRMRVETRPWLGL